MYHVRPVIVVILIPALALFVTACGGSTGEGPSGSGNEPNQTTLAEETSPSGDSGSSGPVEVETTVLTTDLEVPWGL